MEIVIHYDELAIKGKNRSMFERRLEENIRIQGRGAVLRCQRLYGRMIVTCSPYIRLKDLEDRFSKIMGIAMFAPVEIVAPTLSAIEQAVKDGRPALPAMKTFAVHCERIEKTLPFRSKDVEERLGDLIRQQSGAKVLLNHPEKTLRVDILNDRGLLSWNRFEGARGLPVGVSGKVLTLLSGGFDSPVALWMMLRRGCSASAIHFHSAPLTDRSSQEKVKRIIEVLNAFSPTPIDVKMISLAKVQERLLERSPASTRVLLLRWVMFRVAQHFGRLQGALALVTGESLGQVASQTIPNLTVASAGLELPVLRPLIGFTKLEIMNRARSIGTEPVSRLPDQDCCSLFVPKHPVTTMNQDAFEHLLRRCGLYDEFYAHIEEQELVTVGG